MITDNGTIDIEFGGPASYRIIIKGSLDQDWSDRLAGMTITVTDQEGDLPVPRSRDGSATRPSSTASSTPSTICTCRSLRVEQVEEVNSEK